MKFVCTHGHLHNEQWRADNCAACKRNWRRRVQRGLRRVIKSNARLIAQGLVAAVTDGRLKL